MMLLDIALIFFAAGLWLLARTKLKGILLAAGTMTFILSKAIVITKFAIEAK